MVSKPKAVLWSLCDESRFDEVRSSQKAAGEGLMLLQSLGITMRTMRTKRSLSRRVRSESAASKTDWMADLYACGEGRLS